MPRGSGRERRAGAKQFAERGYPADQDHGQVLTMAIMDLSQQLVQAAEHLAAAIGQVGPGVRLGDHQDPAADAPGRLIHESRGFPGFRVDQVRGGYLGYVPWRQQPRLR
jgi:hypothetical protein